MPLMQACFNRCGEPIHMRVDKFDYLFTENQYGDFVANVTSEDHIKYLIQTGNFKAYTTPTRAELEAREKAKAAEEAAAVKAAAKADAKRGAFYDPDERDAHAESPAAGTGRAKR